MQEVIRATSTFLILAALWVPPGLAIAHNRVKPDISTALGIPYAFLAGIILALLLTLVFAVCSRRWPAVRPNYVAVAGAGLVAMALLFAAERGMLSISA